MWRARQPEASSPHRRSGSARARRGSPPPPSTSGSSRCSSGGYAARTTVPSAKSARSSRAGPSRPSADGPTGRGPADSCSGDETVGDADAVHRRDHLMVQRRQALHRVTGRERRVGEERGRDERGQGEREAECSRAAHADTVAAIERERHGPFGANSRGQGPTLRSGFDVRQNGTTMSLRGQPLEQEVTLPDGRVVMVRVGIAEDSYIPRRELDTVTLEIWDEGKGEHRRRGRDRPLGGRRGRRPRAPARGRRGPRRRVARTYRRRARAAGR